MLKVQLLAAFGLLALVTVVSGACECQTSGIACINETAFAVCINGEPSDLMIGSCKPGQVCTAEPEPCQTPTETILPACGSQCNKCDGNFACVSRTEFALCRDEKVTENVISCPPNKICDIFADEICVACDGKPTCSNAVIEKPDPTKDYGDTCKGMTETRGVYKNIYDSTCKTYVYCEKINDDTISILYNCKDKFFDTTTKKCVSVKPKDCA